MEIILENCNNIDNGKIVLKNNILNIKYGINGTGKSTISKAIAASIKNKQGVTEELKDLLPFKLAGKENIAPNILGIDNLTSVKVFDEDYVKEFLFKPNELVNGSFDIFIRGEDYEKGIEEIELLIKETKEILSQDKEIQGLIDDFTQLSHSFGRPTQSGIHGSSKFAKALSGGNKIINIPKGLEIFQDFIQDDNNNHKWVKWQHDGKLFIDLTDNCPYCVTKIEKDKKDTIKRISEVYEPKAIENLNEIIAVFERLNNYFTDNTNEIVHGFIRSINGYTEDQVKYLREIREQAERLMEKFINAQNLGFQTLKDIDKIVEGLKTFTIDLNLYTHLNSEKTKEKVKIINDSITELLAKAGSIQGKINIQKKLIEKLIEDNKNEINSFLKNAGYQYFVDLRSDNEKGEHKLKLVHNDIDNEVTKVQSRLSFGERNAFAIILFMYDALKENPDLIILDDPISSFDKNKKYAVIDMLFRQPKFFRDKTVLLLTHDFDPVVDMLLHHPDKFAKPFVTFLENNKGILTEKEILRDDIKNFIEINYENIKSHHNIITKLIYLRRLYEVSDSKGDGYHLISNLLHKRICPRYDENNKMSPDQIKQGIIEITAYIADFDYEAILNLIKNDEQMIKLYETVDSNYEKLHIYRIIFDDKNKNNKATESDVIKKFINEAFHIENNYIYHLNPCSYQVIPQYIIDVCDTYIELLKSSLSS